MVYLLIMLNYSNQLDFFTGDDAVLTVLSIFYINYFDNLAYTTYLKSA